MNEHTAMTRARKSGPVTRASNRLNVLKRWRGPEDPATLEAAIDVDIARLQEAVEAARTISPRTAEQALRLASLLPAGTWVPSSPPQAVEAPQEGAQDVGGAA